MKQKYQVTLTSTTGKYKPVSCIITREQAEGVNLAETQETKKELINAGIQAICCARLWSKRELTEYCYTRVKVRLYNPLKIKEENAAKYERIKAEKYASGEWKKPKGAIK